MKTISFQRRLSSSSCCGFTAIEWIIAIAVVVIFAVMLCPKVADGNPSRTIPVARVDIGNLETAIIKYQLAYGRWPVSTNLQRSGMADFTFGTAGMKTLAIVTNGGAFDANNSEVLSIIMDMKKFGNNLPTPNHDGSLNPLHIQFFNGKIAGESKRGLGVDGVYRDPWGNPYIITIDLDSSGRCQDAYYSRANVSSTGKGSNGFYGLLRQTNSLGEDVFELRDSVMIWSFGPDGKADPNVKANQGVNKDNVLGWRD